MHTPDNTANIVQLSAVMNRPKPRTIVIGDVARWQAQGMNVAPLDGLDFIAIDALNAEIIAQIAPETILSPLIADTFDAYEVAALLADCAYPGRYCVISDPLPDPDAIIAEVAARAPDIWFDIFIVPA